MEINNFGIKKPRLISLLSILMIYPLPQMAIDIYLPSWPTLMSYLKTNHVVMQVSLIVYLFFLGIAQLIYGPLSEQYGRKRLLLIGISIFLISSLLCIYIKNAEQLILLRIFQAIGIGCGYTIASAMLSDLFKGKELAKFSSYSAMVYALSVIFAPVFGGYIQYYIGWKANFLILVFYSAVLMFFILSFINETKKENLSIRDKKLQLGKTYLKLFSNKNFTINVICLILGYGVMVSFNMIAPFLLQSKLHLTAAQYGQYVFFIGMAYFLGSIVNTKLIKYFELNTIITVGFLILSISSFGLLLINYFTLMHPTIITLTVAISFFSVGFIYPNCFANALDSSKEKGFTSAFIGCAILIGVAIGSMTAFYYSAIPEKYITGVFGLSALWGIVLTYVNHKLVGRRNSHVEMSQSESVK